MASLDKGLEEVALHTEPEQAKQSEEVIPELRKLDAEDTANPAIISDGRMAYFTIKILVFGNYDNFNSIFRINTKKEYTGKYTILVGWYLYDELHVHSNPFTAGKLTNGNTDVYVVKDVESGKTNEKGNYLVGVI